MEFIPSEEGNPPLVEHHKNREMRKVETPSFAPGSEETRNRELPLQYREDVMKRNERGLFRSIAAVLSAAALVTLIAVPAAGGGTTPL
jgi:hypothetical protein